MPTPVVVPRLGWTMEQGVFVEWLKKDGDPIKIGDPLFVLEGEKATQDIESTDAGQLRLLSNGPRPGETVLVGATVAFLVGASETWNESEALKHVASAGGSAAGNAEETGAPDTTPLPPATILSSQATSSASADPDGLSVNSTFPAVVASPRARRIAAELGVDWRELKGSGKTGRVREADIRAAAAAQAQAVSIPMVAPVTPLPLDDAQTIAAANIRRTIAERMLASSQQTAPVTLNLEVDATHLVALRRQFQSATSGNEVVPSFNDVLVKLAAIALKRHPDVNSRWDEGRVLLSEEVHIGIAVDTPLGLIVPVLRSVGRLTLRQVAVRSRDLIDRARQRKIAAAEMQGGTFTITNLGMFGIDAFTPILNPPQAAILGVGRIKRSPAAVDEQIVIRDLLVLSLTFDHRIIDGAPASRFLQTLGQLIENPAPALIV